MNDNKKRKPGRRRLLLLILAAAVLIGVILGINHNVVHYVFRNLTAAKIQMDTSAWTGGISYEKLPYSDVSESDYMNLYVPDSDEPMPLFVLVHGGGFVTNDCESRQAQFMYRYFREQGYACASINYRLAQEAPYPAALEDVKAAVRFLRANAETYGYDADKIAIWGESAGGYLATMAAVTNDEEFNGVSFIGEEELTEPVSSKVDVLVDYYGAIDFDREAEDLDDQGVPRWVRSIANSWLNGNTGEFATVHEYWLRKNWDDCTEEELAGINPVTYCRENLSDDGSLKIMICHGDVDITVSHIQSERFYDTLKDIVGAENVIFQTLKNGIHADDRFFSDEYLGNIKTYLDNVFGQ